MTGGRPGRPFGGSDGAGVGGPLEGVGAFHLPEQREQHDGELSQRIGWVARVDPDRAGQVADPDTALGELVDQVQGVTHRAAQPVQGVHHDHVPRPGVVEQDPQPGPVGGGAGLPVQIDPMPGSQR